MGFVALLLLILVACGGWLYIRWSALREEETRREEAAVLFVMEAKSRVRTGVPVTPEAASGFYPTLPGNG